MNKQTNIWLLALGHLFVVIFAVTADASVGDIIYVYVYQQIAILIISGITAIGVSFKKQMILDDEIYSKKSTIKTSIAAALLYLLILGLVPLLFLKSFHLKITPGHEFFIWLLMVPFVLEQILVYFRNLPTEIKSEYMDLSHYISKETVRRYLVLHVMIFVVGFATQGGKTEGNVFVVLIILFFIEGCVQIHLRKAAALDPELWVD